MNPFLVACLLALPAPVTPAPVVDSVTFVVLGHLRGTRDSALNRNLPELIARVRQLQPAFAVLLGDLILGDPRGNPVDSAWVESQWDHLDSALAGMRIPMYRTPGNHDISDLVTRNIWLRRYGAPSQVIRRDGLRLVIVPSAWIPADGDTRLNPYVRPEALDSAMVRWLADSLAGPAPPGPTLVFTHHLLWWEAGAPWWRDVHPLLRAAGVPMVFGGDFGPLKFSHAERDGIQYLQTSIEAGNDLEGLRKREYARILSSQFDNFLVVHVKGREVKVDVEVLGALTNEQFTAERFNAMMQPLPTPPRPLRDRVSELLSVRRVAALVALLLAVFAGGWWFGRRRVTAP